ncbi:hypothetical protein LP415_19270 [Polaromonas sp. P1(28)-8]|nr:hypothetical protein LP415_19270 [Polaromonas sp. P1(28)-8]
MATVTAIIALIISVGSLIFSIYQYRILHRMRTSEKATLLLRLAQDLRRKSEDLKHKINSTDDVDDHAEFLAGVNAFLEDGIPKLALSKDRSIEELFEMEQHMLSLELEIDLFHKQVVEVGRFNDEVREHEKRMAARAG